MASRTPTYFSTPITQLRPGGGADMTSSTLRPTANGHCHGHGHGPSRETLTHFEKHGRTRSRTPRSGEAQRSLAAGKMADKHRTSEYDICTQASLAELAELAEPSTASSPAAAVASTTSLAGPHVETPDSSGTSAIDQPDPHCLKQDINSASFKAILTAPFSSQVSASSFGIMRLILSPCPERAIACRARSSPDKPIKQTLKRSTTSTDACGSPGTGREAVATAHALPHALPRACNPRLLASLARGPDLGHIYDREAFSHYLSRVPRPLRNTS
ncbi:hypothetical protein DHEL01_v201709 [Diaporthe helianthi]|uniref:Uncharacterized protein n=1 Tax=Diaporthe helianthi TaxID=158607 RepID=A0A2P5IBM9_DIAHE|nr:hypothetical protein DHEL01_v201709 [Diaporthe helianthi]